MEQMWDVHSYIFVVANAVDGILHVRLGQEQNDASN